MLVEVLIPDFKGPNNQKSLNAFRSAAPMWVAHNIETIERLTKTRAVMAAAITNQSLKVLADIKRMNPAIYTKSSIMWPAKRRKRSRWR